MTPTPWLGYTTLSPMWKPSLLIMREHLKSAGNSYEGLTNAFSLPYCTDKRQFGRGFSASALMTTGFSLVQTVQSKDRSSSAGSKAPFSRKHTYAAGGCP